VAERACSLRSVGADANRSSNHDGDVTVHVPIIVSKIVPDEPPRRMVIRTRLDDVLDSDAQVVVISAPAGYGKSTLVTSWIDRRPDLRIAWTSFDPLDRNPVAFWRHLIAAVARVVPEAVEADQVLLERGADGDEHVAALANILLADGRPLVLVLDELHLVDDHVLRSGVTYLVDRCRRVLRLVALGRRDPALPLGRWRAEGRSVEIRDHDLAFRTPESAELLGNFGIGAVDADGLERLNERTEGWAAGLLLSALALQGRSDLAAGLEAVLDSDRHLVDYLVEEVLERLDPDLRQLAFELSVPPFFDDEMAVRLTERPDAAALLRQLVRTNPFVVAISSEPTYRFHHLFRSILSAELRWRDPNRHVTLRRRTAEILVEREQIAAAVGMFLELGDVDRAFDLVVRPVLAISDAGRLREFAQWFQLLPHVEPSDVDQALDYALALIFAGRSDDAIEWADRSAGMLPEGDERRHVLHAVTTVVVRAASGRFREAAEFLPVLEGVGHDVDGSTKLDSRMSGQVVRLSLALGDLDRAERWLPEVERHSGPIVAQILAPALRASVLLERGDVRGAGELASRAAQGVEELQARPHPASLDAFVTLARVHLARMQVSEADVLVEHLAEDADVLPWPWMLARTWPLLLDHRALHDGWPAALELASSWASGSESIRRTDVDALRDELVARALLACGRIDDASALLGELPPSRKLDLLQARAGVVRGLRSEVEEILASSASWEVPERLEAMLLLAQVRSMADADQTMRAALELAASFGWLSPFVLEGRAVERLLDGLPVADLHPELSEWRQSGRTGRRTSAATSISPLTAKEREVLVKLPSHLTYAAIGSEMYLSINTVKTYVSAIYRKLGVSSRSEAVAVARAAGLVDS
jgi:LuxR family transcriptional regulator, maltose regulon positive regulatory protein